MSEDEETLADSVVDSMHSCSDTLVGSEEDLTLHEDDERMGSALDDLEIGGVVTHPPEDWVATPTNQEEGDCKCKIQTVLAQDTLLCRDV